MIKTCGENDVKIIIWRGEKKKMHKSTENKRQEEGDMCLIKLHNLKYNAHDKY